MRHRGVVGVGVVLAVVLTVFALAIVTTFVICRPS